jgi:DnaJ-class molecular chaperone
VILSEKQATMAMKNYYVVLGVHREASSASIRAAYRDLAKRLHPDRIGEHGNEAFQEISEAYQTLSDPEQRRLHNHLLDQEEDRWKETGQRLNVRRDLEVEAHGWEEVSIVEVRYRPRPSFDQLLRNFSSMAGHKAERAGRLDFEVILTGYEARRGGFISVEVPAIYACSICGGSGRDWMFPCFACQGLGVIDTQEAINIRFPPGVRSGTVIEASGKGLGAENLCLRLYLVIDG